MLRDRADSPARLKSCCLRSLHIGRIGRSDKVSSSSHVDQGEQMQEQETRKGTLTDAQVTTAEALEPVDKEGRKRYLQQPIAPQKCYQ